MQKAKARKVRQKKQSEREGNPDMADDRRNADEQNNPVMQYIVNNPEAFAHNLAKMMENGGKALAAYLEPREKGKPPPRHRMS